MVHDGERVLLLHRRRERGNFWQPITGAIEDGETAAEAAKREVREETGHAADPEPMQLTQSFMIESQFLASRYSAPIIASEVAFVTKLDSAAAVHMDADEHDDFGWFTFEQAYEMIRWTDDREAFEQLEQRLRGSCIDSMQVIP